MEERYNNIDEQREWNSKELWEYSKAGDIWSEKFGSTENLWWKYIYPTVKEFKNKDVLEIAPGFGRITAYLINIAKSIKIVDLNELCIEKCKERFGNAVDEYYINNGKSLSMLETNSLDLVFSYDSFVHMHQNVVEDYIGEITRVLRHGGYGWIHHSDLIGGEEKSFLNVAGRANMNSSKFLDTLKSNGLKITKQFEHQTGDIRDIITIFKKTNMFS